LLRIARDLVAADESAPRGGAQQRRQHADGGRLAGAVRADEAEDVTLLQPQRQVLDGYQVLVLLPEVLSIDHSRWIRKSVALGPEAARPATRRSVTGRRAQPMSSGGGIA